MSYRETQLMIVNTLKLQPQLAVNARSKIKQDRSAVTPSL